MENPPEVREVPSSVLVPPPIQMAKPKNPSRFKNFLLIFFLIEHIVILLLLLVPAILFIRTYASTDYAALNEKASHFKADDKDVVFDKYMDRYKSSIIDFVRPENETPVFEISIEERDLNTQISDLKLDNIEKIYIEPGDNNSVIIWVKTDKFPYPIIFDTNFIYNYQEEDLKLDIVGWSVGPLAFPPEILGFIEESVNESAWEGIQSISDKNHFHFSNIETAKGKLNFSVQVDDKTKFVENILNSSEN